MQEIRVQVDRCQIVVAGLAGGVAGEHSMCTDRTRALVIRDNGVRPPTLFPHIECGWKI